MVHTLFSWLVIGGISLGMGSFAMRIIGMASSGLNRDKTSPALEIFEKNTVITIMMGMAALTAYAQAMSLVTKLGAKPLILIAGVSGVGILICYKDFFNLFNKLVTVLKSGDRYKFGLNLLIVLALGIIFAMITASTVTTYDSSLYHAQAIHWIEDYGIVKGLGNLYHRFAYDSAFFSLQALFSLRWLLGDSTHAVNGFVAWIFVSWAVLSIKPEKNIFSNLMRILLIWYLTIDKVQDISSPNSDVFVLSLVIFIFINWIDTRDVTLQCILCLLSVFALTLKLSAALMVLLVISPAVWLVVNKKYKEVALYICLGCIILIPCLARNYILSGYLLYPYPQIDIFNVDWKMAPYMCSVDGAEIKMWGRGIQDVTQIQTPFLTWFSIWWGKAGIVGPLLILDALMLPIVLVKGVNRILVPLVAYANGLLWFVGAPLPRYGSIYLFVILICNLNHLFGERADKLLEQGANKSSASKANKLSVTRANGLVGYAGLCLALLASAYYLKGHPVDMVSQQGIYGCQVKEVNELGTTFFVPSEGSDLVGYNNFPAVPYVAIFDKIELLGDSFEDGFKLKDEYKDSLIIGNGNLHEKNIFQ